MMDTRGALVVLFWGDLGDSLLEVDHWGGPLMVNHACF